jgi:hypothetical protein
MPDWLGHVVVFFLSGLSYWLVQARRPNFGTVVALAVIVGGVYFVGWWTLITFLVGVLFAAHMYVRAVRSGKDPFSNPWR